MLPRIGTMIDNGAGVYLANASAMWAALIPGSRLGPGYLRVERPESTRLILRRPLATGTLVTLAPDTTLVIEDLFAEAGEGPLTPAARTLRMPVMNRPAGGIAATVPPGLRVVPVTGPDELAVAERVIVDGFPMPNHQPWARGQFLSERALTLPGCRVWLGYREQVPAAAACVYDDGTAAGLYWFATLPEHRSCGLGRALLTTALAERPDRVFTLVATEAGRPLYESLGFVTVAMTTWHRRPPLHVVG